jgi:hypothetical protein
MRRRPLPDQEKSWGGSRPWLFLALGVGCMALLLLVVVLLFALLLPVLLIAVAPYEPPVELSVPEGEERIASMTVCNDDREIWLLGPSRVASGPDDFAVVPGDRVGPLRAGQPADPQLMARYGWVAMDEEGGFLRWWEPGSFSSLDEAEAGIRQVMAFCEVCCAAGTVRLADGEPERVWLEDPRFATADGARVGGSFDALLRSAPPGTEVEEDEMEGLPAVSLGDLRVLGDHSGDAIGSMVVRLR